MFPSYIIILIILWVIVTTFLKFLFMGWWTLVVADKMFRYLREKYPEEWQLLGEPEKWHHGIEPGMHTFHYVRIREYEKFNDPVLDKLAKRTRFAYYYLFSVGAGLIGFGIIFIITGLVVWR